MRVLAHDKRNELITESNKWLFNRNAIIKLLTYLRDLENEAPGGKRERGNSKKKKILATDRIWGIFLEPFREIPARGWDEDRVRVDILTACTSLMADRQTATPFTLHVFIQWGYCSISYWGNRTWIPLCVLSLQIHCKCIHILIMRTVVGRIMFNSDVRMWVSCDQICKSVSISRTRWCNHLDFERIFFLSHQNHPVFVHWTKCILNSVHSNNKKRRQTNKHSNKNFELWKWKFKSECECEYK